MLKSRVAATLTKIWPFCRDDDFTDLSSNDELLTAGLGPDKPPEDHDEVESDSTRLHSPRFLRTPQETMIRTESRPPSEIVTTITDYHNTQETMVETGVRPPDEWSTLSPQQSYTATKAAGLNEHFSAVSDHEQDGSRIDFDMRENLNRERNEWLLQNQKVNAQLQRELDLCVLQGQAILKRKDHEFDSSLLQCQNTLRRHHRERYSHFRQCQNVLARYGREMDSCLLRHQDFVARYKLYLAIHERVEGGNEHGKRNCQIWEI